MRISSHWGGHEPLDFICVRPDLVAEFHGDTAVDHGRWRHPVRLHRLRTEITPAEIPAAEPGPEPSTPPRPPAPERTTKRGLMAASPKRTVYHITPGNDPTRKWQVEHKDGRRAVREPHRTQREAIEAARRQAEGHQPAEVVVHGRDGRVRTAYTYGNDPRTLPG